MSLTRRMDVPELPASVVVRLTDGDTLRGKLAEERTDRRDTQRGERRAMLQLRQW
jgi:hypothetical protein